MLRDNATNPIHFDRFRSRNLRLCLALGLLPLTVMATAQTTDSEAPSEGQVPESVEREATETESRVQGCQCCGGQGHAGQGRQGQGRGGRIRNWDPLFREIFDRREAIEMQITDIEGGVEVTETSEDDQVAKLIRAHAVKVEEFVDRGLAAYKEETPLPEDYSETRP